MGFIGDRLARALPVGLALAVVAGCAGGPRAEAPASGTQPAPAAAPTRGYLTNIERATLANEAFRRVLFTGEHMQLVLMTLRPGEDIGTETHPGTDQFVRVEAGTGQVVMNGASRPIEDGSAVVIPAGIEHNIVNTGSVPLRFYLLYSPPEHAPGTVQRTKREAAAERAH